MTATWNFLFIFLLWLSGVCTASVLNFPYFITSLCLALCWGVHLNRTRCFLITQRIVIILITLYSAIHLILLYVYQLQSAQDLVPRPSVTARCVCFTCVCPVCQYVCVCVCPLICLDFCCLSSLFVCVSVTVCVSVLFGYINVLRACNYLFCQLSNVSLQGDGVYWTSSY